MVGRVRYFVYMLGQVEAIEWHMLRVGVCAYDPAT